MAGGHAWQGDMCGGSGACMVWGMHGRGHVWRGVCMLGGHPWQEKWQLQRAVHILLECILVLRRFSVLKIKNKELGIVTLFRTCKVESDNKAITVL